MTYQQEPVTLPVTHLPSSTSFYLSALQPLGYRFITHVQHTDGLVSESIGLGPENSSRVDLFLAQSGRHDQTRAGANGKRAHVVFPASSPEEVRNFYTLALQAGGRPVRSPDNPKHGKGIFAATVTDLDGNKVEVCYSGASDPDTNPTQDLTSHPDNAVSRRTGDNASSVSTTEVPRRGSVVTKESHSHDRPTMATKTTVYPTYTTTTYERRTPHTSSRPNIVTSPAFYKRSLPQQSKSIDMSSKTAVGTLFGTAAGAAIAYAVLSSEEDSRRKETEHRRRVQDRDALKLEARTSRDSQEVPVRPKNKAIQRSATDRDSGYYSSFSRREESPNRLRSVSYTMAPRRPSKDYSVRGPPEPSNLQRSSTMPVEGRYADAQRSGRSVSGKSKLSSSTIKPLSPSSRVYRYPDPAPVETPTYSMAKETTSSLYSSPRSKHSRIESWTSPWHEG